MLKRDLEQQKSAEAGIQEKHKKAPRMVLYKLREV